MLTIIKLKPLLLSTINTLVFSFLFCCISNLNAQFVINEPIIEAVSIHEFASIANAGKSSTSIEHLLNNKEKVIFSPISNMSENVGFTTDVYWVQFEIENNTEQPLNYFLETARPIIDSLTLYSIDRKGEIRLQQNGDAIAFKNKSIPHRKSIFEIAIQPKEIFKGYLQIKNDGESLVIPLKLHSDLTLMKEIYGEQIFYGLFYGVVLLAFIIYFFFFLGLKSKVFLWYSLYILFVGLLQFAVDGFFHQYITPEAGWLNNRAVLLIACLSVVFFLKYTEYFLEISNINKYLPKVFNLCSVLLGLTLTGLIIFPKFLEYGYPLANFIGLIVLLTVIGSITLKILKKQK